MVSSGFYFFAVTIEKAKCEIPFLELEGGSWEHCSQVRQFLEQRKPWKAKHELSKLCTIHLQGIYYVTALLAARVGVSLLHSKLSELTGFQTFPKNFGTVVMSAITTFKVWFCPCWTETLKDHMCLQRSPCYLIPEWSLFPAINDHRFLAEKGLLS